MVAPTAAAIAVLRCDDGEPHVGGGERRRGVEAEPAEQQDERAEHGHRDVVRRQRARLPVCTELPDAGPEDDRARERRDAAHRVDDARACEVDVAEAELEVVAELAEPAAAPGPPTEQRVVERAAEQAPADERLPLPALGHRAGRDRRRRVHEGDHVQEERGDRRGVGGSGETPPGAAPQERPVTEPDEAIRTERLVEAEVPGIAEPREHQREADQEERDEAQPEHREVRADDVRRVLGPAEPGLHQCEAGLHEDHEHRADDDPQEVDSHPHVDRGRARLARLADRRIAPGRPGRAGHQRDDQEHQRPDGHQPPLAPQHHPSSLFEVDASVESRVRVGTDVAGVSDSDMRRDRDFPVASRP